MIRPPVNGVSYGVRHRTAPTASTEPDTMDDQIKRSAMIDAIARIQLPAVEGGTGMFLLNAEAMADALLSTLADESYELVRVLDGCDHALARPVGHLDDRTTWHCLVCRHCFVDGVG